RRLSASRPIDELNCIPIRGYIDLQKARHEQPVAPAPLWIAGRVEKSEVGKQMRCLVEKSQVDGSDLSDGVASRWCVDAQARPNSQILSTVKQALENHGHI